MIFTKEPESLVVVSGTNATFQCEADAVRPTTLTYFWKFNGEYIDDAATGKYYQYNNSLKIHGVNESDNGTYQCVAFSADVGTIISKPAKLQIACMYPPYSFNFLAVLFIKKLYREITRMNDRKVNRT